MQLKMKKKNIYMACVVVFLFACFFSCRMPTPEYEVSIVVDSSANLKKEVFELNENFTLEKVKSFNGQDILCKIKKDAKPVIVFKIGEYYLPVSYYGGCAIKFNYNDPLRLSIKNAGSNEIKFYEFYRKFLSIERKIKSNEDSIRTISNGFVNNKLSGNELALMRKNMIDSNSVYEKSVLNLSKEYLNNNKSSILSAYTLLFLSINNKKLFPFNSYASYYREIADSLQFKLPNNSISKAFGKYVKYQNARLKEVLEKKSITEVGAVFYCPI